MDDPTISQNVESTEVASDTSLPQTRLKINRKAILALRKAAELEHMEEEYPGLTGSCSCCCPQTASNIVPTKPWPCTRK